MHTVKIRKHQGKTVINFRKLVATGERWRKVTGNITNWALIIFPVCCFYKEKIWCANKCINQGFEIKVIIFIIVFRLFLKICFTGRNNTLFLLKAAMFCFRHLNSGLSQMFPSSFFHSSCMGTFCFAFTFFSSLPSWFWHVLKSWLFSLGLLFSVNTDLGFIFDPGHNL